MKTQVEQIIDAARAEMSDNPHKIRTDKLFFAVANLVGRREALEQIQQSIEEAAYNLRAVLLSPGWQLAGHGFGEQPYSKSATLAAVANFRASVREVQFETEALRAAKAEHRELLRSWSRQVVTVAA